MKKMKKVLAVALSLVMAGSLAACGSSSTETKASETAGAAETAQNLQQRVVPKLQVKFQQTARFTTSVFVS